MANVSTRTVKIIKKAKVEIYCGNIDRIGNQMNFGRLKRI